VPERELLMKAPKSVKELMTLLASMEHRERFVFPASRELKKQFHYLESIEVYSTTLFEVKGTPQNINIKAVTIDGKLAEFKRDGSTLNKSKYLRLFHEDYAKSILSIIDGSYILEEETIGYQQKKIA
jgi:hypothetical protein